MRLIQLILTAALLSGLLQPLPPVVGAGLAHYLLEQGDTAGQAWLQQTGARQLADYGTFSLWQATPSLAWRAAAAAPALSPLPTAIRLRGLVIDSATSQPEPDLPAALRAASSPDPNPRLWIIQFAGPPRDSWFESLRASGQTLVACLNANACVLWGPNPAAAAARLGPLAAWNGPFHPAYRLHPDLRPGGALRAAGPAVEVTLQFIDLPAAQADWAALERTATALSGAHRVLNFRNVRALVPVDRLDELAALPTLFNIEPYNPPQKNDEMQGQVLAGSVHNYAGNIVPDGPGYLAWLNSLGFSTDPASYPILDIVDDGVDNGSAATPGHPDFYAYPDGLPPYSRIVFANSCLADGTTSGIDGHGTLNAGIAAGFNNLAGSAYKDGAGYSYGLGISPYGRLASTKIFNSAGYDISACGGSLSGLVQAAYAAGARISSNSWGSSVNSSYDSDSQEYDALTRDAASTPGLQEMLQVFAAGNDNYSGAINSPGTAKNVLTVGATDLPRDVNSLYGCGFFSSQSSDNLAVYSSRGPTDDGRTKPDLVAPGTHIQGPASQVAGYTGSNVCNQHYPPNQTLYTWSNGTSHSTPAVAGAAQLAWERYQTAFGGAGAPSPAMLKALLLNTPRYLSGQNTGGKLPSNNQGWGMPDLSTAFDATPRFLLDQGYLFGSSGESLPLSGKIAESGKPLHISLVWSDAPGTPVAPALINDLDLEVTLGGVTYKGNVFSTANSTSGGSRDSVNNVENVFLTPDLFPAGNGTPFTLRVLARSIRGDGLPGNADLSDQDFALVVYNAQMIPSPNLIYHSLTWTEDLANNNANGSIQPGETAHLTVTLQNLSPLAVTATAVQAVLQPMPGTSLISASASFPAIPSDQSAAGSAFSVQIAPETLCSAMLTPVLAVSYQYQITPPTTLNGSTTLTLPELALCTVNFKHFLSLIGR